MNEQALWEEISEAIKYNDQTRIKIAKMIVKEFELKSFEEVEELMK